MSYFLVPLGKHDRLRLTSIMRKNRIKRNEFLYYISTSSDLNFINETYFNVFKVLGLGICETSPGKVWQVN